MPSWIPNLFIVKVYFTDNSMTYFAVRASRANLAQNKVRKYLKTEHIDTYLKLIAQPIQYTLHHEVTPLE